MSLTKKQLQAQQRIQGDKELGKRLAAIRSEHEQLGQTLEAIGRALDGARRLHRVVGEKLDDA